MKVFVTGGTGFIGGHVVAPAARAGRRRAGAGPQPREGRRAHRARLRARPRHPRRQGRDPRRHGGLRRGDPRGRRLRGRDPRVRAPGDVRGERDRHRERAARRAGGEARRRSSTSPPSAPSATPRARSSTRATSTPARAITSYYEETKVEAHRLAKRLIAEEGLPCVIVQPGGVYGPDDHSALGRQMNQFLAGRMPLIAFPELGINMVHVDDVADGVLLALDKGKAGEAYVLGGQITTMRELIETLAQVCGQEAAEARPADRSDEGDDPARAGRRQGDEPGAEPARADQLGRQRHLLGQARQGDGRARLLAARPRAGPPRHARGRGQAPSRGLASVRERPSLAGLSG